MKRYILENREQIFQKVKVNDDQVSRFVKLFDSSFNDLRAIGTEDDVDSHMEARLMNRREVLGNMRIKQREHFAALKKVYDATNHKAAVDELGELSDVADELVNLNFLAHVDEVNYVFHDRLTLEAMAAEVNS